MLTRCADDQIRIGLTGGVEVLRDAVDGDGVDDLLGGGSVGQFFAQQGSYGVNDFLATTVTNSDIDVERAGRTSGRIHRAAQPTRRVLPEEFQITDRTHGPPVGRGADLLDDLGDDLDETRELIGVALQILRREQVHGRHLNAGVGAPPQHLGDLCRAHPVAVGDVLVTGVTRPAPITVAQHRDMARQHRSGECELLAQPHLVEPVCRLLESRRNELHDNPDYCGHQSAHRRHAG